jgi:gamma-glutamyltranspeptidase / glutathione hydrolase
VTVPGSLAGWAALLQDLGTLALRDALAPAIRLAEEGFPVSPIIAEDWQAQEGKLRADAGARATYLVDGERAPRAGEWHRNPELAHTFRRVGEEGPGSLYGGELGRALVDGLAGLGGFLTLEDLAAHRVEWVDPIHASYRGHTIHQLPPPNQGIAALQMLRLLEPLEPGRLGHNSAEYIHLLTEVKKLAFADLAAHVADPDHMLTDAAALLSEEYLAGRRGMIDGARAASRVDPGHFATRSDTVYLSVADGEGTMVSLINSIYSAFGSGVVIPGTGIALQNRGAGFRLEEGHPNSVAPGKRPFHTIIPAMVTRAGDAGEEAWLSYGVMGAAFQPQGQVQVLLNLLEFGMDLQEALDAPRFAHTEGVQITLEEPIGEGVRSALEALGHKIGEAGRLAYGGAQAVMRLPQGWAAASDPRKDGQAGGR